MRAKRVTAALSLALLAGAGCTDPGQPSPPPEPVESLGGSSATSEPPPPDTETETATATAAPTTEAGGAPELPPQATEQTEAGAEAFAQYYVERVNREGQKPQDSMIDKFSDAGCESCKNYEQNIKQLEAEGLRNDGDAAIVNDSSSTSTGETFVAFLNVDQLPYAVIDSSGSKTEEYPAISNVDMKFDML